MFHAEPVLFVDHRQHEARELNGFLNQRVRADDEGSRAVGNFLQAGPALRRRLAPGDQTGTDRKPLKEA